MIEGHEVEIGRAVGQYYASCTHDTTTTLRHTVYVTCKNLISIPISPLGLAECIGNMIKHIMLSLEGSRGNIAVAVVTKLRFQKKTRFLYLQVLPHFGSGARLTRKSDVNRKEEYGVKVIICLSSGRPCILVKCSSTKSWNQQTQRKSPWQYSAPSEFSDASDEMSSCDRLKHATHWLGQDSSGILP